VRCVFFPTNFASGIIGSQLVLGTGILLVLFTHFIFIEFLFSEGNAFFAFVNQFRRVLDLPRLWSKAEVLSHGMAVPCEVTEASNEHDEEYW